MVLLYLSDGRLELFDEPRPRAGLSERWSASRVIGVSACARSPIRSASRQRSRPDSVVPWLAGRSWIVILNFDITGAMHRNAGKPSSQRLREPAAEPEGER